MKKFAAVIAVMALCSALGDGSRAGRFFWPIGNAKSGRRIPGPNGSVTTVESAKSLRDDTG